MCLDNLLVYLTYSSLESVLGDCALLQKVPSRKAVNHLKGGKQTKIQMSKWYLGCGRFCHINRTRATAEKQFVAKDIGRSSALSQSRLACLRNLGEE